MPPHASPPRESSRHLSTSPTPLDFTPSCNSQATVQGPKPLLRRPSSPRSPRAFSNALPLDIVPRRASIASMDAHAMRLSSPPYVHLAVAATNGCARGMAAYWQGSVPCRAITSRTRPAVLIALQRALHAAGVGVYLHVSMLGVAMHELQCTRGDGGVESIRRLDAHMPVPPPGLLLDCFTTPTPLPRPTNQGPPANNAVPGMDKQAHLEQLRTAILRADNHCFAICWTADTEHYSDIAACALLAPNKAPHP
ncbi:uncharacterized protein C8Q71DRAFT_861379 [Rhodofomes roseus]|uniref:Uncharacterized protein n=1 Tax=Rhodofomes roseus TaxID=34475 RepID=A0ABQ8K595_9APHY|nr:uncharacterized protein C8Q71DRAFT_861379 [Rhodofomes roseus]KAH9832096.1 hypothetical protein C8Q71DRAFT_861379 [Rhodofomes roseus]